MNKATLHQRDRHHKPQALNYHAVNMQMWNEINVQRARDKLAGTKITA